MVRVLLRSTLSVVHVLHLVDVHARGANRACLLVQCGDQAGVLLADRGRNLCKVALRSPIRCRVDLEGICT